MKNVLVAPGKYIQGRGVLKEIGQWAGCLGHNAVVLWSPGRRRAVGQIVKASLAEADLTMREVEFGGESTRQEAARVAAFAKDAGADVMIGIGGGKALDTAKAAAAEVGCRMMTCPTIASNDTPTSAATVWYDADGHFEGFECWPFNPDIVLVDSQVVVDGPIQTFAAGMGDALATWVEAEASYKTRAINLAGGVATQAAMAIAELAYTNLMAYGLEARRAAEQHLVTPAVERIIETNVLLSGLGFESGGLATAHMIANPLSNFPECKHAMHGEKVSF
ncbi:MAG: glycerol dehydrogenase, partial [Alphaproteobacteria bacterium]